MNREKTSLFFNKKTSMEIQNPIKSLFGAQIIKQHDQYLGLPFLISKGKKKAFKKLKDQVGKTIVGWKGKLLSNAGWETLIKAIAQAALTYTICCFKLPESLCWELGSMISRFWRGQKMKRGNFLGFLGISFASQRLKGAWALGISRLLTSLSWQNKAGASCRARAPCSTKSSRLSTLQMLLFWMHNLASGPPLHGEVLWLRKMLFLKALSGTLAMARKFESGMTNGCQPRHPTKWRAPGRPWVMEFLFHALLITSCMRGRRMLYIAPSCHMKLK